MWAETLRAKYPHSKFCQPVVSDEYATIGLSHQAGACHQRQAFLHGSLPVRNGSNFDTGDFLAPSIRITRRLLPINGTDLAIPSIAGSPGDYTEDSLHGDTTGNVLKSELGGYMPSDFVPS